MKYFVGQLRCCCRDRRSQSFPVGCECGVEIFPRTTSTGMISHCSLLYLMMEMNSLLEAIFVDASSTMKYHILPQRMIAA